MCTRAGQLSRRAWRTPPTGDALVPNGVEHRAAHADLDWRPMTELRSGEPIAAVPVSPELALVDPALAAQARASLPDPVDFLVALRRLEPIRAIEPLAADRPPLVRKKGSVRVLVGVAAVLVATLLLADVRVEVGRTGASAEAPVGPTTSAQGETTKVPPQRPRARAGAASRGKTTAPRRSGLAPRRAPHRRRSRRHTARAPVPCHAGSRGLRLRTQRGTTSSCIGTTRGSSSRRVHVQPWSCRFAGH